MDPSYESEIIFDNLGEICFNRIKRELENLALSHAPDKLLYLGLFYPLGNEVYNSVVTNHNKCKSKDFI